MSRGRKVSIAVIVIVAILSIAAAYFFFKIVKNPKTYKDNKEYVRDVHNSDDIGGLTSDNNYVVIEPMVVNLLTSGQKPVYLRLSLMLKLATESDVKIVQTKLPVIVDELQVFLTGLRPADLSGTGGSLLLKEELTKRINKITSPILMKDVLLKEILIN